ncbi:non-homologous end-joining DNA ligase [Leekyejoonella antrihumi]|uniref:DNA ligase (ATP) n=1 Tax=Leekyejoonella antrihumi TaxID=1660198 RepID=A0A563DWU2_9MICO|nr:non-homologous end-joining DNA ligase [Leekyejoonella antrihumi]TWP34730.1 DNA ligase [Leekyejoonella antrihumi]
MRPMLATPAATVPVESGWQHEVKWDGMRILADVRDHRLRLWSRTERDVTVAFPELLAEDAGLTAYEDLLLDGEVVVLRNGVPSFGSLADRFNLTRASEAQRLAGTAPVTFMAFDVLRIMGHDVMPRPLRERRELLEGIDLATRRAQIPVTFADGAGLATATRDRALEGVVSKRVGSAYRPGRRSVDWQKVVHRRSDSFVIGGWRRETGSDRLGAVLIGAPSTGGLVYCGRVGSGLAGRAGERLRERLQQLRAATSPFSAPVDREDAAGAIWVRPDLVVDVEFRERSTGGRLRAPTWRGLRGDLSAADLGTPSPRGGLTGPEREG